MRSLCSMWMGLVAMKVWMRERVAVAVHVALAGPGQGRDHGPLGPLGHGPDRLEVAHRGLREPRLDDVDAQPGQLLGDLYLGLGVEVDAWCLLPVAQGGVEDD